MIRFQRVSNKLLDAWLVEQKLASPTGNYRLRLWRADSSAFDLIKPELKMYFDEALENARVRLRLGFNDDLSPFNSITSDPAINYPSSLNRVTLQGYLGETLAVLAVEHWGAHGYSDWQVPAFLFRFHDQEFQHLEAINQRMQQGNTYDPDDDAEKRPGRTGDDALAFRISDQGEITDVLMLESKCLSTSNSQKIADAYSKFDGTLHLPSGVRELIALLSEYDTADASLWQRALLKLWSTTGKNAVRLDGVCYACGNIPQRPPSRLSWLPPATPHADYTAGRNLESFEFQIIDLKAVVDAIYRGA